MTNHTEMDGGGFAPHPTASAHGRAQRALVSRKIALSALMRCPLCNAINARTNAECFICGWHGKFQFGEGSIRDGVEELFELCPELADAMAHNGRGHRRIWHELRSFWFRFVHRFSTSRKTVRCA
jgi:hypothetical protein